MKIKDLLKLIDNVTSQEALEYIVKNSKKSGKKTFVITPNTEILMMASRQNDYALVLRSADLALADSVGVMWAAKMLTKPLKERIPGSDLVDKVCARVAKQPITVGFLGGKHNVALVASERLVKKYPGLKVTIATDEWRDPEAKCDILFVAFGSPKQEVWISENLSKINVKIAIGVGGSFDYISGRVRKAPDFIRKLGLEWLFRLIRQPWRIKRQLRLVEFVGKVLSEKFLNFSGIITGL